MSCLRPACFLGVFSHTAMFSSGELEGFVDRESDPVLEKDPSDSKLLLNSFLIYKQQLKEL